MTRKDGNLLVGSHGREFVDNGVIINTDKKWVKDIDPKVLQFPI